MKNLGVYLLLFFCAARLASPPAADAQALDHRVYRALDRWEALGLLGPLQLARPYPPDELLRLLAAAAERGGAEDSALARGLLAELSLPAALGGELAQSFQLRLGGGEAVYAGLTSVGFRARANPARSLWIDLGADLALVDGRAAVWPYGEGGSLNLNDDASMFILPKGLSGDAMGVLYALDTRLWYGGSGLWARSGFSRSGVGPFWDNGVFVGPQAPAAPYWGLNADFGRLRFATSLYQLSPQDPARSLVHEKYAVVQTYSFSPFDGLDLGLIESAVWAGSFKPQYLVPFSFLFFLQSSAGPGYGDNSLAGAYASWNFAPGFIAKASAYFDDVGVDSLFALDFDAKLIGAVQAGLAHAPRRGTIEYLAFDYTAVFPYMYSHYSGDDSIQDNYTHGGESFGAALRPNSDRALLRVRLQAASALGVEASLGFLRHGNASEGVGDGDGGWFDDGYVGGFPSYQAPFEPGTDPRYFRFVSQSVIERTVALRVGFSWAPAMEGIRYAFEGRFGLDYAWNRDLVPGAKGARAYAGLLLKARL